MITVPAAHPYAERMSQLAESFPALRGKPGVRPWEPGVLNRWIGMASSGEQHCARFVLYVWDQYYHWRGGRFDLIEACNVLDDMNRAAIIAWLRAPWFA